MKCCLCGDKIYGYGNNPYPLCDKDDYESRCCNDCDGLFVIPARMGILSLKELEKCMKNYKKFTKKAKKERVDEKC